MAVSYERFCTLQIKNNENHVYVADNYSTTVGAAAILSRRNSIEKYVMHRARASRVA